MKYFKCHKRWKVCATRQHFYKDSNSRQDPRCENCGEGHSATNSRRPLRIQASSMKTKWWLEVELAVLTVHLLVLSLFGHLNSIGTSSGVSSSRNSHTSICRSNISIVVSTELEQQDLPHPGRPRSTSDINCLTQPPLMPHSNDPKPYSDDSSIYNTNFPVWNKQHHP